MPILIHEFPYLNAGKMFLHLKELRRMTQRKKDYAEYRDAKNEMRELLTVRANVERILNEPMEQRDEAMQKKQER